MKFSAESASAFAADLSPDFDFLKNFFINAFAWDYFFVWKARRVCRFHDFATVLHSFRRFYGEVPFLSPGL